ncbi:hypothetical protein [Kutzneria sp. NPDC051319]
MTSATRPATIAPEYLVAVVESAGYTAALPAPVDTAPEPTDPTRALR